MNSEDTVKELAIDVINSLKNSHSFDDVCNDEDFLEEIIIDTFNDIVHDSIYDIDEGLKDELATDLTDIVKTWWEEM